MKPGEDRPNSVGSSICPIDVERMPLPDVEIISTNVIVLPGFFGEMKQETKNLFNWR